MKTTPLTLTLAAVLAAGATGAAAQTYGQAYQTYQQQYSTYQAQQAAYNAARAKYEADRAAYDARYGVGAYERLYGPFRYAPAATYGYGYGTTYPYATYPYTTAPSAYGYAAPYAYNPYYAGAYGVNASYGTMACNPATSSVNLGVLSTMAQAALSGRSASSVVNEAILGAVVDRALGSRAISNAQCDASGYYYTYAQTQPYREGHYDAYGRWVETPAPAAYASCRIAPAPADAAGATWRYVRVCPDASGRYRITA